MNFGTRNHSDYTIGKLNSNNQVEVKGGGSADVIDIYEVRFISDYTPIINTGMGTSSGGTPIYSKAAGYKNFITGARGNDTITSGPYDDAVYGGLDSDNINTGSGNDRVYGSDGVSEALDGNDIIDAGNGADTVYGNAGNDTINGNNGNDSINGGDGADYIRGYSGDDITSGGSGNDTILGGWGNDLMSGGTGADTFNPGFDVADIHQIDVITDFRSGEGDKLNFIDAAKPLQTHHFSFIGSASFSGIGQLQFDAGTHTLYANMDGNFSTIEYALELAGVNTVKLSNLIL